MNILITGGATGIGLGLAENFYKRGHNIGILGIQSPNEVTHLNSSFFYFQVDVSNEEAMHSAVNEFVKKVGTVDMMIANAGLNMPKTIVPDTKLGKTVTMVNVVGVINAFSASLPHFLKQGSGHFAAMSSLSGLNGLPGMSYYGASKAFVGSFCESLAIDLKEKNIAVSCFYPGFIATDFTKKNQHPMPFLLTPEKAVEKIVEALLAKKEVIYFPLVPSLFMGLLRRLPRFLYYPIMRKDLLKLRHH
jgi:short-subunit dehydrogenase